MQKPRIRAAFRLNGWRPWPAAAAIDNVVAQKSEAIPLFSQSPYLVGSGPLGPWTSFGTGLAFASAAFLRASASASARFAAGVSCLRSGEASVAGNEGSSVIASFQRGNAAFG